MSAPTFAGQVLGSKAGVQRGWRAQPVNEAMVADFFARAPWLPDKPGVQMVAMRGWSKGGELRRVDVAYADGSRVSLRRLAGGRLSTRLERWRR